MPRYRLTLTYDGGGYAGWQVQPAARTLQAELERPLAELAGQPVKAHASGRTDQGVHARGQVVHFDLPRALPPRTVARALNAKLPPGIRVLAARLASADFHARKSARRKEYRYFIWNAPILPPLRRYDHAHVRTPLDVAAMRRAARRLVGRHDFAAFTANPNREVESTVRTLSRLGISRRGSEIVISAVSDGFLYKMVRSLCGFLIRVGEGAAAPEQAAAILASRTRTARVPTAPPQGLFLWHVTY